MLAPLKYILEATDAVGSGQVATVLPTHPVKHVKRTINLHRESKLRAQQNTVSAYQNKMVVFCGRRYCSEALTNKTSVRGQRQDVEHHVK